MDLTLRVLREPDVEALQALFESDPAYTAREWPEVRRLRLAVVDTNAEVAPGFWRRLGFEPTGEAKPYRYHGLESVSRLWERALVTG